MRNFILAAALFLTAGIASAAVVHEEFEEEEHNIFNTYYAIPQNAYYLHDYKGDTFGKVSVSVKTNSDGYTVELYNTDLEIYNGAGPTTPNNYWNWSTVLESAKEDIILTGQNQIGVKITKDGTTYSSYTMYAGETNYLFSTSGRNTIVLDDPSKGVHAEVTFGSPLPTPVITLLIALGFGAAFVMYRNRKQVNA